MHFYLGSSQYSMSAALTGREQQCHQPFKGLAMHSHPVILNLSLLAASLAIGHAALADPGPETAQALQARYHATPVNCDSVNKPRFLCAGVILRGTTHLTLEKSWNPTPEERDNCLP